MKKFSEWWREFSGLIALVIASLSAWNSFLLFSRLTFFVATICVSIVFLCFVVYHWNKTEKVESQTYGVDGKKLTRQVPILRMLYTALIGFGLCATLGFTASLWWNEPFVVTSHIARVRPSLPTAIDGAFVDFAFVGERKAIDPTLLGGCEYVLRFDVTPKKPDCRIQEIGIEVIKADPAPKNKPAVGGYPKYVSLYYLEIDQRKTGRYVAAWDYEANGLDEPPDISKWIPKKLSDGGSETILLRINATQPGYYVFKAYMKVSSGEWDQTVWLPNEYHVIFDKPGFVLMLPRSQMPADIKPQRREPKE